MSIEAWQFRVTAPGRTWVRQANSLLEQIRAEDALGQRRELHCYNNPQDMIIDLATLEATTLQGESLLKTDTVDSHMQIDPGNLTFAGTHYMGEHGHWLAFTQPVVEDTQEWYWPITGEYEEGGTKAIDQLNAWNHILVGVPLQPRRRVVATLVIPTDDDAGMLSMYDHTKSECSNDRCVMPTTWVFETLAKGLLARP